MKSIHQCMLAGALALAFSGASLAAAPSASPRAGMAPGSHSSTLTMPTTTQKSTTTATAPTTTTTTTRGPTTTGQPNQNCETLGNQPGNAISAPGSAFNPNGTAGGVYAGNAPQSSVNTASVSQYDVACARPSGGK